MFSFEKINKSFNSEYRVESIPSKNNLGYDIDQNGERKIDARSLQYAYHNGTKLIENAIEISNDYQIRYFKIKSQYYSKTYHIVIIYKSL